MRCGQPFRGLTPCYTYIRRVCLKRVASLCGQASTSSHLAGIWRAESGRQVEYGSPGLTACYIQCLEGASSVSDSMSEKGFSRSTLDSTICMALITFGFCSLYSLAQFNSSTLGLKQVKVHNMLK